jgi:hypothetical protein
VPVAVVEILALFQARSDCPPLSAFQLRPDLAHRVGDGVSATPMNGATRVVSWKSTAEPQPDSQFLREHLELLKSLPARVEAKALEREIARKARPIQIPEFDA